MILRAYPHWAATGLRWFEFPQRKNIASTASSVSGVGNVIRTFGASASQALSISSLSATSLDREVSPSSRVSRVSTENCAVYCMASGERFQGLTSSAIGRRTYGRQMKASVLRVKSVSSASLISSVA